MIRKIVSQSALVGFFGLIAGGFNYLYLATAIKKLDINLLAELNTYLSWFQISLCVPALIQSFIVLRSPTMNLIKKTQLGQWIVSVFLLFLFMILYFLQSKIEPSFFILITLLFSFISFCFFNFWLGVFQGMRLFLFFSSLGLFLAFTKFIGVLFAETLIDFVSIIFISVFISSVIAVAIEKKVLKNLNFNHSSENPLSRLRVDLMFSFFVGLFIVLLPNYDVLIIRYLIGLESAGEYSRIQIFTKIIFFAPMILLQITLPYYVSEFKNKSSPSALGSIRKVEILGFIGSLLLCVLFGLIGPTIFDRFFGFNEFNFEYIFLGCLSVLPTYLFMSSMQIFAASRNLSRVLLTLAALFVLPLCVGFLPIHSVMEYLKLAVIVQFLLAFFIFMITQIEVRK